MGAFRALFNGYAVAWSPFLEQRLAVATAQNFGIIGYGKLHVLEVRHRLSSFASCAHTDELPCRWCLRVVACCWLSYGCLVVWFGRIDAAWGGSSGGCHL